jgi:hypothetical protein
MSYLELWHASKVVFVPVTPEEVIAFEKQFDPPATPPRRNAFAQRRSS